MFGWFKKKEVAPLSARDAMLVSTYYYMGDKGFKKLKSLVSEVLKLANAEDNNPQNTKLVKAAMKDVLRWGDEYRKQIIKGNVEDAGDTPEKYLYMAKIIGQSPIDKQFTLIHQFLSDCIQKQAEDLEEYRDQEAVSQNIKVSINYFMIIRNIIEAKYPELSN